MYTCTSQNREEPTHQRERTQIRTRTHTRVHTHTHVRAYILKIQVFTCTARNREEPTHPRECTQIHTRTHTLANTYTHKHAHTRIFSNSNIYLYRTKSRGATRTHTPSNTYTHAHTQTYIFKIEIYTCTAQNWEEQHLHTYPSTHTRMHTHRRIYSRFKHILVSHKIERSQPTHRNVRKFTYTHTLSHTHTCTYAHTRVYIQNSNTYLYSQLQKGWHRILRPFLKTFNLVPGVPGFPRELSLVPCYYVVLRGNPMGRILVCWKGFRNNLMILLCQPMGWFRLVGSLKL